MYVGRPSKFGNPFTMKSEKDRDGVIEQYEKWLSENPNLIEKVKQELRGKNLICWCAPKACHADILLKIANE